MITPVSNWGRMEHFWPALWLSAKAPAGVKLKDPAVDAAAALLRVIDRYPLPIAICMAEMIKARLHQGDLDPVKSSLAIVNDRYLVWEDRPGAFDVNSQRHVDITSIPAVVVRYNPAGIYGGIHAEPAPAVDNRNPD